jgi:proteasome lid subunit RPN8/RPN11
MLTVENALEVVGMAFETVNGVMWYELTNISDQPDRRFEVDGEEVRYYLQMHHARPFVLWHSHVKSVEPSITDLESFPVWLTDMGAIFHAPSGQTTLYDASGVIFSPTPGSTVPLATQHNTES